MIDLNPPPPAWPAESVKLLKRCLGEACGTGGWKSPPAEGTDELREALARWLKDNPERVSVTCSVRSAVAMLAVGPSRRVLIEVPTYRGIIKAFRALGHQVITGKWAEVMAATDADLVWITSPGRNPDGRSLTSEECVVINAQVIQDEIYRPWAPDGHDFPRAVQVGSFSKIAGGGARIGWIRGSQLPVVPGMGPPVPWQQAWALFLDRGGMTAMSELIVNRSLTARNTFLAELDCFPTNSAGPSVALVDRDGELDIPALIDRLLKRGIRVADGIKFEMPLPGIRLTFGAVTPGQAKVAAAAVADEAQGRLSPMVFE